MYVKNSNLSTTDVVNYPCDNGKYDHYGQRSVRTFILIKKKTNDQLFDSGDGSMENPYIIKTARHIQNMHKVTYSKGTVYFRMEADVNMAAVEWQPLNATSPYDRIIDFDGFKQKTAYEISCSLVGSEIVYKRQGNSRAGGIVGIVWAGGILENCYATGDITVSYTHLTLPTIRLV